MSDRLETLSNSVRRYAEEDPGAAAATVGPETLTYSALDLLADNFAGELARRGVRRGETVAVLVASSTAYLALMVATDRIGAVIVPLPLSADAHALAAMIADAAPKLLILDEPNPSLVMGIPGISLGSLVAPPQVEGPLRNWQAHQAKPNDPVTIIYSSGTTGTPKGIVQPQLYRSRLLAGGSNRGYSRDSVTLLATPLYSNTTLASVMQTIGSGGHVVLMPKFEAGEWLRTAEMHRVTHAMLVPVMIERILAHPDFETTDLSSFVMKYCTSAPFAAELKRAALDRWPGGLIEFYGMTEGGASFALAAHRFPDKLHTVGQLSPGSEVRILDENDNEVDPGHPGEIVGRAPGMMVGYHNRPDATAACRWRAPDGTIWQRTGDIGIMDDDGFLTIVDRKKDMIISGGFNVYPADIEAVIAQHPAVSEASVVGVPDKRWGETPVAFVAGDISEPESLREWINARVGKMQRVSDVVIVDALPRGEIGKVLKRELRQRYSALTTH